MQSREREIKLIQDELSNLINRNDFKFKFHIFKKNIYILFIKRWGKLTLSMSDFPESNYQAPETKIDKLEVDWTIGPKLYKATYKDGHVETF